MNITREFVEENKDKRFTVVFEDGRKLINIKFFISTVGNIAFLTGRQKRRGYAFPAYDELKEIIEVKKRKAPNDISNAKTILKKIHPNVWESLKTEMNEVINNNTISQDFEWHFRGKLKFRNISKLLTSTRREELKQAFENKTEFRWNHRTWHHRGRDLSISTQIHEDGQFRAYFSSEYMGCGNGDYWLLLNPTTAIYYEAD
jgi:hypothetical protein